MDPKKLDQWGRIVVSVAVLAIFGVAYALCIHFKLNDQLAAFGQAAINMAMIAVGYWLGSSSGSAKKDDTIAGKMPPV